MDRGESKDQIIDTVSALVLDPIWFFFSELHLVQQYGEEEGSTRLQGKVPYPVNVCLEVELQTKSKSYNVMLRVMMNRCSNR